MKKNQIYKIVLTFIVNISDNISRTYACMVVVTREIIIIFTNMKMMKIGLSKFTKMILR